MPSFIERMTNGHRISSAASSIVLLCFFLPWVLVSCGGMSIEFSGWDLAAGKEFYGERMEGNPLLFVIPIVAIVVIMFALIASQRGHAIPMQDGAVVIGLGTVSLILLLIKFANMRSEAEGAFTSLEYKFGLWGTIIGLIVIIIGGVLNMRE